MRVGSSRIISAVVFSLLSLVCVQAADKPFHDAPASAKAQKNPFEGQQAAADAGKQLYARNCLACHGKTLQGTGNVPSLVDGAVERGDAGRGVLVRYQGRQGQRDAFLGVSARRQAMADCEYVEAMASGKTAAAGPTSAPAPEVSGVKVKSAPPTPPFTDFRYEKPGTTRKITVKDLPKPFATDSAENGAELVARPENAWPVAPAGFKVELFAAGLENPRLLRTAPNGDIFLAESEPGEFACSAA